MSSVPAMGRICLLYILWEGLMSSLYAMGMTYVLCSCYGKVLCLLYMLWEGLMSSVLLWEGYICLLYILWEGLMSSVAVMGSLMSSIAAMGKTLTFDGD